ncbi:MAG TPA: hypothetical protein VJ001_07430 [Rhodocyclaceae bacterium]|nr:hypothetical protein [Rhodocyclaceae bacterium]
MNFSDLVKTLNQASAFELYRLRAAISGVLEQAHWNDAIRSQLQVGQVVEYFNARLNGARQAKILELGRKDVQLADIDTGEHWRAPYASVNLNGIDAQIREQERRGLSRNEVAIGDIVGFLDRKYRQRSGQVVRLNEKTVTIRIDNSEWRVGYDFLHRVVESDAIEGEQALLNAK